MYDCSHVVNICEMCVDNFHNLTICPLCNSEIKSAKQCYYTL